MRQFYVWSRRAMAYLMVVCSWELIRWFIVRGYQYQDDVPIWNIYYFLLALFIWHQLRRAIESTPQGRDSQGP